MITIKGVANNMIANNIIPTNPIHPGEMIKEEIESRGITQKQLSEQTGISYTVINEIINKKRAVTIEYALLLEAALGIEAGIWIRTQTDFNIYTALNNKTFLRRLQNIRKAVAMI